LYDILNCKIEKKFGNNDSSWSLLKFYCDDNCEDFSVINTDKMSGNFGLLFKRKDLPNLIQYLYENFDKSPIDWLISEYMYHNKKPMYVHSPNLLNHIGSLSSKINWENRQKLHGHIHHKEEVISWEDCNKLKASNVTTNISFAL
jgi:hypothetical protein